MSEVLVKTRITPKKITENIVSRDRLIKKMAENASKNLILVTGPAGYGKTTLVLDFLNTLKTPYAWFYCTPDIDNFQIFLNYLVHSLKNLNGEFGEKTLELAASLSGSDLFSKDAENSVNAVMDTFINEFVSSFEEETFLVIDDLHNLGMNNWLNPAFNNLIESFPANLHIIITSRVAPDFNIAKLSAKRNLLKIESADLNFDLKETEKLLKDIYGISYSNDDLNILENRIEGWITGLHLILQAYGSDFTKITSSRKIIDETIFGYFAEDIFGNLDEATRNFLISTSLLDTFTSDMCDEILNIDNSRGILNGLKKKNLFIESSLITDDSNISITQYSYHNLFKQFLVSKLYDTKNESEISTIAERIFNLYLSAGNHISAIEFSLLAKNYDKAAEMIIANFDGLFRSGRYELLWKWIEQIPEDLTEKDLELLYLKEKLVRFYKNDYPGASAICSRIISKTGKDSKLYIIVSSELSEIMRTAGNPDEALKISKELYSIDTEPELKVKIIVSLTKCYYRLGSKYYDEIIKLLDEALAIAEPNRMETLITEIYSSYGRIYLNKGDFIKSLHYFENTVKRLDNIYSRLQSIYNIVLLFAWSGQYLKAKQYFDEAAEIYRKYSIPIFKRIMIRLTALLKFEVGDYEDTIEKFSELAVIDDRNNFKSYLMPYYLLISEAEMLLGNKDKAGEYLSLAEKVKDTKDEFLQIEIDSHKAMLNKMSSLSPGIEKTLLDTLKYYKPYSIYSSAQIEFHLADYYFKKGIYQTSLKYLTDSLNTSSEKQYTSFLSQHFISMRYLFDLALSNNLQKDYVLTIYNTVLERNSFDWLSEKCRERHKKENLKLFDIHLSTFGGAEILVRGTNIAEDKWIRKKSKLLLIYLLINQGLRIQKDKVLGLFFSELSAGSAENVFHQAITNIRNALKPETEIRSSEKKEIAVKTSKSKKKPEDIIEFSPSYIVYEDKILQLAREYNYKIDVIEFNKMANIVKSSESDEELIVKTAKEAIALYKGEFLPGYYDEWIEELRTSLQFKYIELCEILLNILKKRENFDETITYAEKLLAADKLHEDAYIAIIDAFSKSGNHTMAKKKFTQLLKNYEEEYGEKPPKSVLNQIQEILVVN